MFSIFFLFSLILGHCRAVQNVICNGDFQIYSITRKFLYNNGQYIMWDTFQQNTSCWYRIPAGSGKIQVQSPSYATFWTKVIEIIGINDPYALCQKVVIQINSKYSLSVDIVKPKPVASASAFLYLNNMLVGSVKNTDYLISSKITYNFTALTTNYEICINGSFVASSITKNFKDDFSPLIDNVSLIQIPNSNISSQSNTLSINISSTSITTNITNINQANLINNTTQFSFSNPMIDIYIYLELTYNEDDGRILLVSTESLVFQQYLQLVNLGKIYIEGEEQTDVVYSFDYVNLLFNITISVVRDYDLKTIYIAFPKEIKELYLFRLIVFINGQDISIYVVSDGMIKMVKTIDPVSSALIDGISEFYRMLKLSFCSYFVINIINFYSLTLMYNFLGFSAQPVFSRIALQKLGYIFYKRNSLFSYIQNIFSINELNKDLQFENFINHENERVEKFHNGFSWFGNMGITSNSLVNNFENILIITILMIKLAILALFQKAFPQFTFRYFGKLKNFGYVFIVQFICISPLMTVSAFSTFMNTGFSKFTQKINFFLHLSIQIIIVQCPFLYLLKILKNKKQNDAKRYKKNVKIIQMQFLQYLFNILLPILVIIRNQVSFFVVTTIYIIILVSYYFYSFNSYSILTRIFKSLIILMLITHHFSFMLIYVVGIVSQKLARTQILNYSCKIAGLTVIFTVFCGGLIEVLHFVFKTGLKIIKKIRKLCIKWTIQQNQNRKKQEAIKSNNQKKDENPGQLQYIYAQKIETIKKGGTEKDIYKINNKGKKENVQNKNQKIIQKAETFHHLQKDKIKIKVKIKRKVKK